MRNFFSAILLAGLCLLTPVTSLADTPSRAELQKFAKLAWKGNADKLDAYSDRVIPTAIDRTHQGAQTQMGALTCTRPVLAVPLRFEPWFELVV